MSDRPEHGKTPHKRGDGPQAGGDGKQARGDGKQARGDGGGRSALEFIGIGFEFLSIFLGMMAGGYFLDAWLESSPLWMVVGLGLGFAAGLYHLLRRSSEMEGARDGGGFSEEEDKPEESVEERVNRVRGDIDRFGKRFDSFYADRQDEARRKLDKRDGDGTSDS